jgi:hypothetical protein
MSRGLLYSSGFSGLYEVFRSVEFLFVLSLLSFIFGLQFLELVVCGRHGATGVSTD